MLVLYKALYKTVDANILTFAAVAHSLLLDQGRHIMKFIAAIAQALREFLLSTASGAIKTLDGLLKLPAQVFGFGGPRMPSTPPDFTPTTDPRELLAELSNGHAVAGAVAPEVDPVSLVVRFAKTPKSDRMQLDLAKLDVGARARLWTASEADLAELAKSPRAAIQKFLQTPVSLPQAKPTDLALSTPADLQKRIKALMGGSSPYGTPLTP